MDKKLFIQLLATSAARLVAGYVAIKLGVNASEYGTSIEGFATAFGGVAVAGFTLFWSMAEKKKLLETPAPETKP